MRLSLLLDPAALAALAAGILLSSGCVQDSHPLERTGFPTERVLHKTSDLGTEVVRLTTNAGNDRIFYQEPKFSSPDGRKFLFKSDREDGRERIYVMDFESGEIHLLRNSTSFGHSPTWSKDGREVYVGESGRILVIDVATLRVRAIDVPGDNWITFLHLNPSGDRLGFVEEGRETHRFLSSIRTGDGKGYRKSYVLDQKSEFYLDHPAWLDDSTRIFLTRGEGRNFDGVFNQPWIQVSDGSVARLPLECSHYDVDPSGTRILCGQEGYVIDRDGEILKEFPGLHGHGSWHPDGDRFLMTGDPVPVPEESPWHGRIMLLSMSSPEIVSLTLHESTNNSSLAVHEQPNAQFSRDGRFVIWESDQGRLRNADLFMAQLP